MAKRDIKLIQIVMSSSHNLYGLDAEGQVWICFGGGLWQKISMETAE